MTNWDALFSTSFLRRLDKVIGESFVDGELQHTIKISDNNSFVMIWYSETHQQYEKTLQTPSCHLGGNPIDHESIRDSNGVVTIDSVENYLLNEISFIPHSIEVTDGDNKTTYSHTNWNLRTSTNL